MNSIKREFYLIKIILILFISQSTILIAQEPITYKLTYSSFLGGNDFEQARDMAVDKEGNFYITGGTKSPDFPTTPGVYNRNYNDEGSETVGNAGPMMVFVCKFSPKGDLIWSTFLGGPNYDRAYAIEVDNAGYVYVGGRAGDNFPTTKGAFQESFSKKWPTNNLYGHQNGFVAKLSPDGSELIWATYYGSDSFGFFRDIDVDDEGYVYGILNAVKNLPQGISDDAYDTTLNGNYDMVPVKFSPDGSEVVWATVLGGSGEDRGGPAIRVGPDKSVYVSGSTKSSDWPVTSNVVQEIHGGKNDIFVTRFSPDGKSLIYSTYFGGSEEEYSETHILTVDRFGQAHIACASNSVGLPTTPGAIKTDKPGADKLDALLFKLSADGTNLLACTYYGGSAYDGAEGLYVDSLGYFYVGGGTASDNLDLTDAALQGHNAGKTDAFVIKVSPDFDSLLYASYFGGEEDDAIRSFYVNKEGVIGLSGQTLSTNFPVTGNAMQLTHASPGASADSFFATLVADDYTNDFRLGSKVPEFIIYPNPSTHKLFIHSQQKITRIEILDLLGKIKGIEECNEGINSLEVGDLYPGTYLIKAHTAKGQSRVVKFIKF